MFYRIFRYGGGIFDEWVKKGAITDCKVISTEVSDWKIAFDLTCKQAILENGSFGIYIVEYKFKVDGVDDMHNIDELVEVLEEIGLDGEMIELVRIVFEELISNGA